MNRHPVFVYGTLLKGCGNDVLWQGRATARHDGTAILLGYKLVSNGWFPYLTPAPTAQTVGCLMVPAPEAYDWVLAEMDRLEGVAHNHYERIEVAVLTPEGCEFAWTYVIGDTRRRLDDVATNPAGQHDWRHHTMERNHS